MRINAHILVIITVYRNLMQLYEDLIRWGKIAIIGYGPD